MTFKPSERFAEAVRKTSGVLVAGRGSRQLTAARSFENKLHFVEVARRIGLPTPRWEVVEGADIDDYPALAKRFGERIVVQGPRGNAGQRTWVVSSQDELGEVRRQERGRSLRLSEFVEGLPFTVNAVAYREGLLSWEEPSRQVTGVPWLTPMKLGSCGNAWGTPELEPHLAAVGQALGALAAELGRAGFSGVFGVDFVLGPGGPVVIETNPRMVASLPVSTQLALAAGRVPLLLEHLILGLGTTEARLVGPSLVGLPGTAALPPTSQVIVHRLDSDARPRRAMSSGVYRIVGGREPELRRPGVWLSDIEAADEALLLVREPGEPVTAGKEFARVYLRGAAAEDTPGLRELVDALRGP